MEEIVLERKKKEAQETSEKNMRIQNQGVFFGDRLEKKHKGIGEESNCNQGCPGMLLVTFGILTHIRFLRAFVSEYLIYC